MLSDLWRRGRPHGLLWCRLRLSEGSEDLVPGRPPSRVLAEPERDEVLQFLAQVSIQEADRQGHLFRVRLHERHWCPVAIDLIRVGIAGQEAIKQQAESV